MTGAVYGEILANNFLRSVRAWKMHCGWALGMTITWDTARTPMEWLCKKRFKVRERLSQTLDLNPIEILRRQVKLHVTQLRPWKLKYLAKICMEEWVKIPAAVLSSHLAHCQCYIQPVGRCLTPPDAHVSHSLSSHAKCQSVGSTDERERSEEIVDLLWLTLSIHLPITSYCNIAQPRQKWTDDCV